MILKIISGFFTPPEISGRNFLRKQLAIVGVRKRLPDEFIDEFVTISIAAAKVAKMTKQEHFNTAFVSSLENMALVIKTGLDNPTDPLFQTAQYSNRYRDIFQKFNLI